LRSFRTVLNELKGRKIRVNVLAGADRHTDAGRSSHQGGEGDVRILIRGKDGSTEEIRDGRAVSASDDSSS